MCAKWHVMYKKGRSGPRFGNGLAGKQPLPEVLNNIVHSIQDSMRKCHSNEVAKQHKWEGFDQDWCHGTLNACTYTDSSEGTIYWLIMLKWMFFRAPCTPAAFMSISRHLASLGLRLMLPETLPIHPTHMKTVVTCEGSFNCRK